MSDEHTLDSEVAKQIDANGDGHISKEEWDMHLEFKRKELEDQDSYMLEILEGTIKTLVIDNLIF